MPRFVSWILSPVVMLVLLAFALAVVDPSELNLEAALIYLLVGGVPPSVVFFIQYKRDPDGNPGITPGREEREPTYLALVASFSLAAIIFASQAQLFNNPLWANISMVTAALFAGFYLVNRFFDKPSLHAAIFAFVSMALLDKFGSGAIILFALAPLVLWSRLRLHKHEWIELLWGWAIGMLAGLLSWLA